MRVCMISPHLPPEQAANALLPVLLGGELTSRGIETHYVAHPPGRAPHQALDRVVYAPRRGRGPFGRTIGGAIVAGGRLALAARQSIRESDLVHLHGNGLIIEVGAMLAGKYRKPYVITLYGTDVWHHDPERHARFTRVVRNAGHRVFYSHALLDFARPLGLAPEPSSVIYAPVPPAFTSVEPSKREALRRDLGIAEGTPLLLTVKRLHPVGGQEDLLQAMPSILRRCPAAQLWLVGEGERRPVLEAVARDEGIAANVRFLGLLDNDSLWRYYAAADLFVLPSRLESWGTVMLEALACGTPVVATDTAGGVEVRQHFPGDVTLVPRENPRALADAVAHALMTHTRTSETTRHRLQSEFTVSACALQYLAVYRQAMGSGHAKSHAL